MDQITDMLLWFSVVSVGLMAGVYFSFSAFIMRSLDAIEAPQGMIAMQSINRVIVKSSFLPIFFASSLACAGLTVIALLDWAAPGAIHAFLGGLSYVIGMFIVTLVGNVPLNNRLEATRADGPDGAEIWSFYLKRWTAWNHLRTAACTASMILLVLAIAARS